MCRFNRIATAQGKYEIWMFIFPDRENTTNLPKILRICFTQEMYHPTWEVLKIKGCAGIAVIYCYNLLAFLVGRHLSDGMRLLPKTLENNENTRKSKGTPS